jgi:hypothetical protein
LMSIKLRLKDDDKIRNKEFYDLFHANDEDFQTNS